MSASNNKTSNDGRLPVLRTAKMYLDGKYVRSESARTFPVAAVDGRFLANMPDGSRKDLRDAVVAARAAAGGWSASTALLRGQILYRFAEMLESRLDQLVSDLVATSGQTETDAVTEVSAAIDLLVWYAGAADKVGQLGSVNQVSGPFFNVTSPTAVGVVGVVVPVRFPLLGFVSTVAPLLAAGNTVVALAPGTGAYPLITVAEAAGVSDLPHGVVNIITASSPTATVLAEHMDVDAFDGAGLDNEAFLDASVAATSNLKRCYRSSFPGTAREDLAIGSMNAVARGVEYRTVWHPIGL